MSKLHVLVPPMLAFARFDVALPEHFCEGLVEHPALQAFVGFVLSVLQDDPEELLGLG